jgi:hypothetical protein
MCVSWCARKGVLFWNHSDCQPADCQFATETHGRCRDCRHKQDEICGLTRAPLPSVAGSGGCCHWNVGPVSGLQIVTRSMLAPLGISIEETEEFVLRRLDVPYRLGTQGEVVVDTSSLATPFIFGEGSEHLPEEELDWSAWLGQWCLEE